ncbi:MAG: hypothetical protein HKN53_11960 [Maribacter sp.]|nr:hypothetical protein [Maribacter sp.]
MIYDILKCLLLGLDQVFFPAADSLPDNMARYDLWILPFLIQYTAYAVYVLLRKDK